MNGKPEFASDVYPMYLKADDLRGQAVSVKIARVDLEIFRGRDGTERPALVLSFEKARRRMILNRTQAGALCRILQSERLADWPGRAVTLSPLRLSNGKTTIEIREAVSNGQ
jgi:hypothetical protein